MLSLNPLKWQAHMSNVIINKCIDLYNNLSLLGFVDTNIELMWAWSKCETGFGVPGMIKKGFWKLISNFVRLFFSKRPKLFCAFVPFNPCNRYA